MFNPKGYDSLTSGVEFCWIDSQCNFTPSDFQYHRHHLRHCRYRYVCHRHHLLVMGVINLSNNCHCLPLRQALGPEIDPTRSFLSLDNHSLTSSQPSAFQVLIALEPEAASVYCRKLRVGFSSLIVRMVSPHGYDGGGRNFHNDYNESQSILSSSGESACSGASSVCLEVSPQIPNHTIEYFSIFSF